MAYAGRFLHPIRASLSAVSSPYSYMSHSRNQFYGKYEQLRSWVKGLEPVLLDRASRFQYKLYIQRKHMRNPCFSGSKLSVGSIFGVSVVYGMVNLWPRVAYAMDGTDILVGEQHEDLLGASDLLEDDPCTIWALARKFWLPTFLVLTVLVGWDHPITLVTKVILFLLSTKPSPLSVYLFVEQSLYANKVEVEDYKLLCLARVELRDQKILLLGILGSWWVLQSSPCQGAFSIFGNRALKNR
ncbi:hypothetical protein HHK36_029597 [Tetracentron sinense]|uniref:Uncharacterized protein n=1 Tax=Tetracentron sinense TaxID=13715 RepID=A0A834YB70_TETSI|nr:hypothetical protein HHK36_029597 [Tetracentron sinense]